MRGPDIQSLPDRRLAKERALATQLVAAQGTTTHTGSVRATTIATIPAVIAGTTEKKVARLLLQPAIPRSRNVAGPYGTSGPPHVALSVPSAFTHTINGRPSWQSGSGRAGQDALHTYK